MKKIGEYTARGTVSEGGTNQQKINLFDGVFDTAYRIKSITVAPYEINATSNYNYAMKVMTNDQGNAAVWNWSDQAEIAWAYTSFDANGISNAPFSAVDKDQLVVEDAYIYLEATQPLIANYEIVFEKYAISDWQGALAMARERQSHEQP
jgi:hypothetical protein